MVGHYINKGVEGGVEVSNPEKNRHHHVGARGAGTAAYGGHYVPGNIGFLDIFIFLIFL